MTKSGRKVERKPEVKQRCYDAWKQGVDIGLLSERWGISRSSIRSWIKEINKGAIMPQRASKRGVKNENAKGI